MTEPADPTTWTAGRVRKATPLPRRWDGAGAPPPGYAYDWRRAARVPVPANDPPPDLSLIDTYDLGAEDIPLPVAEARREVNRALVAICSIGALIVVGIMLALGV